jgi:hypothetical protein
MASPGAPIGMLVFVDDETILGRHHFHLGSEDDKTGVFPSCLVVLFSSIASTFI